MDGTRAARRSRLTWKTRWPRRILERLGFVCVFRYEKYRSRIEQTGGQGAASIDETPIGVFVELEGPPRWIGCTARELGFSRSDYITVSYGQLYQQSCEARGRKPGGMIYETSTSQPRPGVSDGRM